MSDDEREGGERAAKFEALWKEKGATVALDFMTKWMCKAFEEDATTKVVPGEWVDSAIHYAAGEPGALEALVRAMVDDSNRQRIALSAAQEEIKRLSEALHRYEEHAPSCNTTMMGPEECGCWKTPMSNTSPPYWWKR